MATVSARVLPLSECRMHDVATVGGKNSSLGELISQLSAAGVNVPGGFATTAETFREFLTHSNLTDKINAALLALDVDDIAALNKTDRKSTRLNSSHSTLSRMPSSA